MADLNRIVGTWNCVLEESDEVGRFGARSMEIEATDDELTIRRIAPGAKVIDTITGRLDGAPIVAPPTCRTIPDLFTSGLYRDMTTDRTVTVSERDVSFVITEALSITSSQGSTPATIEYRIEPADDSTLVLTLIRSTVPNDTGTEYRFVRSSVHYAYAMELGENWEVDGDLSTHAMLISLQGLANRTKPRLYFIYPPAWDFKFTPAVFDYLKTEKGYAFKKLSTGEEALQILGHHAKGYVVWDRDVRTSLIVAFTIAGVENALVVSEQEIAVAEAAGLQCIIDLRDRFTGQSDAQIYRWAYDHYWDRCSRDYLVWLGGEHGKILKPGVADWSIYQRAFCSDLSARKTDVEEYEFSKKLLSEQNPGSYVFGWHSYRKDTEEEHVSLTSSYGLRVEGLHTLPNMSFSSQIPVNEGFEFRNNHNVGPGYDRTPENKVYIACVQTDCLGIGAWTEPGRGEIPYAWEVTMNWVWLAPAMMEFFYSQATEKDYFIGALSGPGYMYPASIPPMLLPQLIGEAYQLMQRLDLKVFDIMDFTRVARPEGGTPDLDERTVNAYYEGMPGAIGFANGYYPAQTFANKDGRPFFSFDYYLSPTRSKEDAVQDLIELANVNADRPYYLLMHVRNFSSIRRVIDMLASLPPEFETIPLDEFLVMAGKHWNFAEWYATDA